MTETPSCGPTCGWVATAPSDFPGPGRRIRCSRSSIPQSKKHAVRTLRTGRGGTRGRLVRFIHRFRKNGQPHSFVAHFHRAHFLQPEVRCVGSFQIVGVSDRPGRQAFGDDIASFG